MEDCIFCKIVRKDLPAKVRYEDEQLIAIDDIRPSAPVHILVMPKAHIASVKETTPEHQELLGRMVEAARDIARENSLDGYKLVFNVGRTGGQIVDHLHLHLLGGWKKYDSQPSNIPV